MSNEIKQTKLNFLFDTATVESMENNFEPVRPGWYTAVIDSAEIKETRAGNGSYVNIAFKTSNRLVFNIYNLTNPNEQAVKIGKMQFKELLLTLNINTIQDLKVLIGKQLDIKVGVRKDNKGEERNVILSYDIPGAKATASISGNTRARTAFSNRATTTTLSTSKLEL